MHCAEGGAGSLEVQQISGFIGQSQATGADTPDHSHLKRSISRPVEDCRSLAGQCRWRHFYHFTREPKHFGMGLQPSIPCRIGMGETTCQSSFRMIELLHECASMAQPTSSSCVTATT